MSEEHPGTFTATITTKDGSTETIRQVRFMGYKDGKLLFGPPADFEGTKVNSEWQASLLESVEVTDA